MGQVLRFWVRISPKDDTLRGPLFAYPRGRNHAFGRSSTSLFFLPFTFPPTTPFCIYSSFHIRSSHRGIHPVSILASVLSCLSTGLRQMIIYDMLLWVSQDSKCINELFDLLLTHQSSRRTTKPASSRKSGIRKHDSVLCHLSVFRGNSDQTPRGAIRICVVVDTEWAESGCLPVSKPFKLRGCSRF